MELTQAIIFCRGLRARKSCREAAYLDVFLNKSRNKIKILYFDRNGFVMWYKRLERGRFILSKLINEKVYVLSEPQLRWLLDGLDFMSLRGHPKLHYDTFS